jgi:hypothetical protein
VIQSQLYSDYKAYQKSKIVAQNLRNNNETSELWHITVYYSTFRRTRSIAGFLLEQRPRKEKEQFIVLERGYTKAFTFRLDISLQQLIQKNDKSGTIMVPIKIIEGTI